MNIAKIKKAQRRIDVGYLSTLEIKSYGANNLYPQQAKAILDSSSTGSQCADRYARFIEGGGFVSDWLYQLIVNRSGETCDDLLSAVSQDLANYGGFALHVNYDLNCRICEIQQVPFENCRLQEEDDAGYIGHIVTHPDWSGKATRRGKVIKVSKDTITTYDRFNPAPSVVKAQILASGGIESYKGQILWVSMAGRDRYPLPKYDRVLTDLSTDEGLSNVKFRNVRCNFLPSAFVVSKVSQALNEQDEQDRQLITDGFAERLEQFQGDEVSNVLLSMTIANEEEKPEIVPFPVKNFDKEFSVTDTSIVERIYCAFEQEPFLCVRYGKVGFSGTLIHDCYTYYSSLVDKEQRLIERAFAKVLEHWFEPLPLPLDCSIRKLEFNDSEEAVSNGEQ